MSRASYELVHLEQGERAALYARWPSVFPCGFGSAKYPPEVNRMLTDLHNAVAEAGRALKHGS